MPLVRNETNQPHCVSDLDLTWFPKGHNLGGDVHNLTKEMIDNSLGVQKLIARKALKKLTTAEIKKEAERSAQLAEEQQRTAQPPIEVVGDGEVVGEATWTDPNETHGQAMPDAGTGEYAGGVPLPSDNSQAPSSVADLDAISNDPGQAVGDLIEE